MSPASPWVLAVPDGATEPIRDGAPTSLESTHLATWRWLATCGAVLRARTIPAGLAAGTEVGLPTLLGLRLDRPPSRGRIDAAAAGVDVAGHEAAWRLDADPPQPLPPEAVAAVAAALAPLRARVHPLARHRLLLVGPAEWGDAPAGPHQGGTAAPAGPWRQVADAASAALRRAGVDAAACPWGTAAGVDVDLPGTYGRPVRMISSGGAGPGLARSLGAELVSTDLAEAADVVAAAGDELIVVHDVAPDHAAHARDANAKAAALERFDTGVLAPMVAALRRRGNGSLVVAPDHGCDPATGVHDAEPVPATVWAPSATAPHDDAPVPTERGTAALRPVAGHRLLGEPLRGLRGRKAAA